MRTFIAIDISWEAKREIEKFLKILEKKHWPVKWEKAEKLHLTLVFFGNIEENKLPLIKLATKKISKEIFPFQISFKGLGCFPSYDYPRVLWLGLKGDLKSLASLQKKLEKELVEKGFKIDLRPFSPHLSLGRIRPCPFNQRKEIGRQLKALRIGNFQSQILIDKIIVYQSKLSPKGSKYIKLAEFSLKK